MILDCFERLLYRSSGGRCTLEDSIEQVLETALTLGASDVHLNPDVDGYSVWFRTHGIVTQATRGGGAEGSIVLPKSAAMRLKVMSRMPLGEQRKPQDGRFRFISEQHDCHMRVAAIPTVSGERFAVRLLPQATVYRDLAKLGMPDAMTDLLHGMVTSECGLILLCGAIGTGKSTTAHALLRAAHQSGRTILTIEDPVEVFSGLYSQVEVDERSGLTFAEALRAALRQDPDVIMVGEIRDHETATIAVRAGMTGHLVITTLHADNPASALLRLAEMGIAERYLDNAVRLVVWQNLIPVYCSRCSGTGCGECHGVGVTHRHAQFASLIPPGVEIAS